MVITAAVIVAFLMIWALLSLVAPLLRVLLPMIIICMYITSGIYNNVCDMYITFDIYNIVCNYARYTHCQQLFSISLATAVSLVCCCSHHLVFSGGWLISIHACFKTDKKCIQADANLQDTLITWHGLFISPFLNT